jgi:DNA-binding transcriptional LysR family regulator
MSWPDIEAFIAVAKQTRLTRAAERLGTSVPTLHRRISALETRIGVPLFVRTNSGHGLTEAGQRLLPSAEAAQAAIGAFEQAAATARVLPEGTVRIAAPDAIVLYLLGPRTAALRGSAPHLVPEFLSSPSRARLLEREADIAVRLSDPGEDSLFARRMGTVRFGLYAPEGATSIHEATLTAEGVLQVPWIGWTENLSAIPAARSMEQLTSSSNKMAAANALPQQLALARALNAAILLPEFVAESENGLRRVAAAPWPLLEAPIWLVVNPEVRGSPTAEAIVCWIEDSLVTHFK